jgi:hypothetical protein
MGNILTPSTIYEEAVRLLPAADIGHCCTDLYVRVTPESRALMRRFQYKHMVTTFITKIDGCLWYNLPFCYDPTMTGKGRA